MAQILALAAADVCAPHMADDVVKSSPLSGFLGCALAPYSAMLKAIGYDDVNDFANVSDNELNELVLLLQEEHDLPVGHARRIERLIKAERKAERTNGAEHGSPTPARPQHRPTAQLAWQVEHNGTFVPLADRAAAAAQTLLESSVAGSIQGFWEATANAQGTRADYSFKEIQISPDGEWVAMDTNDGRHALRQRTQFIPQAPSTPSNAPANPTVDGSSELLVNVRASC